MDMARLTGKQVNGLYNFFLYKGVKYSHACFNYFNSMKSWHHRLCHTSNEVSEVLKHYLNLNFLKGLEIFDICHKAK